ncbi:hypothetical protein DC522_31030 [Microvirga sp. KLBC 81]|uniref:family 16 glycosylhydrolase n=1 Tax=Microvirga sp. KLBC 81 TaxID=1862707 RepID=UPI000D5165D7|nr:family 16 glycosylhydrolase [Microvirga sp. KLBC 81]PVE20652.1 hypothetical protein DC522_31030 [Microvirga sp. KLBC 81]
MLNLSGYKLTFDEEFNTRSISQNGENTVWSDIRPEHRGDAYADVGFGTSSFVDPGSGYDPFKVANGELIVTAALNPTAYGYPGAWEAGLIHTKGEFSQTYGYFEMRADLSSVRGSWDAFWLLPDQPWPNPNNLPGWQELDIVEHYGEYDVGTYRWIHTTDPEPNKDGNANLQVFTNNPSQTAGYHTYGMNWKPDVIEFYFDGQFMGSKPTPTDMHGPMYILANLATNQQASASNPAMQMKIDYIRAFSNAQDAVAVKLDTVSSPDGKDPGLYGAVAATAEPPASPTTPTSTTSPDAKSPLSAYHITDFYDGFSQWTSESVFGGTRISNTALDIDGTMTADAINATGSNAGFIIDADTGSTAPTTIGINIKAGSAAAVVIAFGNGKVMLNLAGVAAGTANVYGSTAGTYSIEKRPNGYYHVEVTSTTAGLNTLTVSSNYTATANIATFYIGDLRISAGTDADDGFGATPSTSPPPAYPSTPEQEPAPLPVPEEYVEINGTSKANNLTGTEGADKINGKGGNDLIKGLGGQDILTGGAGDDTFVFNFAPSPENIITITDFNDGNDTLRLDNAFLTALGTDGVLSAGAFVIGSAPKDADDRLIYNNVSGALLYDADGTGTAYAGIKIASLTQGLSLTASDFIVI